MNFARSLLSRRFRLLMTAALFVLGTVPVASVPARADDETAATYCSDGRAQLDQARHFSNQSDPDMWDSAALLRAGKDFGECIHQADDHDLVTAGAAGVVITEIEIAQHFGTLAYEVRGLNGDTALSHKWFDKWRHLALQSLHNVAEFIPIIRKRGGFNRVMEQDAQFAHYFSTIMEGMTFETTPKTADVLFAHIKNITWYAKRISGTPEAPAATAGAPKPAPTETPDATIGEEQDFISNFLSQPGHQVVSDAHVLGGDPYTVTFAVDSTQYTMAAAAVQAELKHDTWTLAAVAYRRFHPGYSPEQTLVIRLLDSTTGDPVDEYSAPLSDLATP